MQERLNSFLLKSLGVHSVEIENYKPYIIQFSSGQKADEAWRFRFP